MASERLARIAANRERAERFFASVAASGECFSWGDDDGVAPWEDRFGDMLVPLWPDHRSAVSENEPEAEPGEGPLRLRLSELSLRLERWKSMDVGLAVHPVSGSIAGTYTVTDFVEQLLRGSGDSSEPWAEALAPLRRVLP